MLTRRCQSQTIIETRAMVQFDILIGILMVKKEKGEMGDCVKLMNI